MGSLHSHTEHGLPCSGVPPFWGETEQQIFSSILDGRIDFESDPWPNLSKGSKDAVRALLQQVRPAADCALLLPPRAQVTNDGHLPHASHHSCAAPASASQCWGCLSSQSPCAGLAQASSRPPHPAGLSWLSTHFLLLVQDPHKRATADQILHHSWMKENGTATDKPLDNVILSRMRAFAGMNKLKKEALRIIALDISPEEIAGLRSIFQASP